MAFAPGPALTPARSSESFAFGPAPGTQARQANQAFINPEPLPSTMTTTANLQQTLSTTLALQLTQLFQDLFPISQNFEYESETITDEATLSDRAGLLVDDILQLKMTVLVINQLTQLGNIPPTRLPAGFNPGGPNSDPLNIAGLVNNTVVNTLNNLYLDVTTGAFESAQSDYARLRNQLQGYFGL